MKNQALLQKSSLTDKQIQQLKVYSFLLIQFNKVCALYSRQKTSTFCWNLIWDSLVASKFLLKDAPKGQALADIGSGAGFPGLVLAILDPSRKVLLYEPQNKKAQFLNYAGFKIGLSNIEVKKMPIQQEKCILKLAVSKAFLPLDKRLQLAQGAFKKGAMYYHLQSLGWQQDWDKVAPHIKQNWQIKEIKKYKAPLNNSQKVLLRTDFIKNLPDKTS